MIKAKKIGLILEKEIKLEATLRNGIVVGVDCEFINADYDRLYLKFPDEKKELAQYFYSYRTITVNLDTLEGRREYPAKILYEPTNELIVVEYYQDENISKKRKILRVRTTRVIDIQVENENIQALTIDISAGGCRILSQVEIPQDTICSAFLKLRAHSQTIPLKIKIKNCNFLPVENKYEIGAEFVEIAETDRKMIMKFCYEVQAEILAKINKYN